LNYISKELFREKPTMCSFLDVKFWQKWKSARKSRKSPSHIAQMSCRATGVLKNGI
jgi:hypothetical protein